jgi:hypothetical protein
VYLPEEPFIHGSLTKTNRLKSFRNLYDDNFSNDYRQVCRLEWPPSNSLTKKTFNIGKNRTTISATTISPTATSPTTK